MLKIKFRAWDNEHKCFNETVAANILMQLHEPSEDVDEEYGKRFFLNQFTGLKDKNGKDIYEGDIIKKPNNQWGVIVYKSPFFEVTIDENQSCMYSREWFDDVEIIGNIHENPELLNDN